MDAGRLQGLAVPFLLDSSCCSHHGQQQLVLSTGTLKSTGTPCLALRHHVGRQAKQRGGKRTIVRAAIAPDLAAVAVAAATVLPVCWLYVNRSQLLAGSPFASSTISSTGKEETLAAERTSSLSPSRTTNGSNVAQQVNGEKNKEAHDDVLTNRQSQYNGGLFEEQWRSVNNKHETAMASVASVEDSETRSSDARASFSVAPTSSTTWVEPSVEDTVGDSLPDDGGNTAYPKFSGRFFERWNSEMPLANEDEQSINQDRLNSGSMASTPQAAYTESVGESDESVRTSVEENDEGRSQNFRLTEENVPGVPVGGSQLENSSDSHTTLSTSDGPRVKVNGRLSRLKSENTVSTGEADTKHRELNRNASLNGSAKSRNGIAAFLSDEKAEKRQIEAREGEADSVMDQIDSRRFEDSVHRSDIVQTMSHPDPLTVAGRSSEVASNKSSLLNKDGGNGSVNGQKPSGEIISSSELTAVANLQKRKTDQRSSGSSRRVPSLSEILPVDSSTGSEFYLKIYEKVLRAARVGDCILLLEEMDKENILDTDQIYHAKFFKACQKQKAVKEAFRFMRLLGRPTLSTYNMLLNVCREARDVDGGLRVLSAAEKAGLKPDSILYTTLISTCAKAGKVDIAFKVFHDMQSAGVVPTIETYGAMIDGCALAGQIAKAFGVYGIMISKELKPDHVIFNTLIKACGRVGAIERAFDVLADMRAEPCFLTPNHVTMGALISACARAGQVDRAFEVYNNMRKWRIKGTAECYTAAVHACSSSGNLELAFNVFEDLKQDGVRPDEIFFSALIDVAGHSKQIDAAFRIVDDMKKVGVIPSATTYSALMGVCCNTGNWERGLQLYDTVKSTSFLPTISTFNALITALCDAKQIDQSFAVFQEMREAGVKADQITYSILLDACEKLDEPVRAFDLYTRGRAEGVIPNEAMCSSVIEICYAMIRKRQRLASYPCSTGLLSGQSNEAPYERWSSWAVSVFRHAVAANVVPTMKCVSLLLGCLRIPQTQHEKNLFEDSSIYPGYSRLLPSLAVEGAGIYDPRALALLDEAASMGVVPHLNYTAGPVTVNAKSIPSYVAEVYVISLLKGLKRRHMEGAQLFPVTILFSTETKQSSTTTSESKNIRVSGRTGREVAALLRRLRIHFHGHESSGKLRIDTTAIRKWLKPTVAFTPLQRYQEPKVLGPPHTFIAQGIAEQQRAIRLGQVFKKPADIGRVPGDKSASTDMYRAPGKRAQANPWDRRETNNIQFTDRINGISHSSPGKVSRLI